MFFARLVVPLAIGVCCLLGPQLDAEARACRQWSADGTFKIRQANGYDVTFVLRQEGEDVSGIANYSGGSGSVEGLLTKGGRLKLVVTWNNGSVGEYTGFVDDAGDVQDGRTYDRTHPESWSKWSNRSRMRCRGR